MENLNRLQTQHQEIRQIITEFNSLTCKANTTKNAEALSVLLGRISGRIKLNYKMEKNTLYQYLIESQNPKKIASANQFLSEMDSLLEKFDQYRKKYKMSFAIKENFALFKQLSKKIFRSIEIRLHLEDKNLYPLVEGIKMDPSKIFKSLNSSLVSEDFAAPLRSRQRTSLSEVEETYHPIELTSEQLKLDQPIRINLASSKIVPNSLKIGPVTSIIDELNGELKKKTK